jgi:hypothetical protein
MMFLDSQEDAEKIESFWNTNKKPSLGNSNLSKVKTVKNTCSILNGNKLNKIQDDDYSDDDDDYDRINELYNRRSNHFNDNTKNLKNHCNRK